MSLTYINNNREWRIILAEGRVLDSKHHNMEGPNTMFKFNSKSAKKSFEDWARLGASHHAILMPGHQKKPFKSFSDSLNSKITISVLAATSSESDFKILNGSLTLSLSFKNIDDKPIKPIFLPSFSIIIYGSNICSSYFR